MSWAQVQSDGFDEPVCALELQDIDWTPTPGFGVTLDITVDCHEEPDLVGVLQALAAAGWVSQAGAWTIEQSERA